MDGGPVHGHGGLLALVIEAGDAHLLQPLLDHLVDEAIVTNKATLVLRRVLRKLELIGQHAGSMENL